MDKIEKIIEKNVLLGFLDNRLVATLLSFLVIVNLSTAMEELPEKIKHLVKQPLFRITITFLSIYAGTRNLYVSVGSTAGLVGALYIFNRYKETFELINPSFDVAPKCLEVNLKTLLSMFGGDREMLKKAMLSSGVPGNLSLTDYDAPLIATYLLQNKRYEKVACA